MANSLNTNPIWIDTFSAPITMSTYYPGQMCIDSIEWIQPTATSHYAVVLSGGASGVTCFQTQCITANQSYIKYFHGANLDALYIPASGTSMNASGRLIITIGR